MSPRTPSIIAVAVLAATAMVGYLVYPRPVPESPSPLEAAPVVTLPDFTLVDLEGEAQPILGFADDGRALLINFWATWCAPCRREIPLLVDFQAQSNPTGVQVVGIAVDRFDDVAAFAPTMNFNYPILIGQSDAMEAASAFGIEFLALPFTVFGGPQGQVLAVHTGEVTVGDLDNYAAVLAQLATGAITPVEARQRMAGRL